MKKYWWLIIIAVIIVLGAIYIFYHNNTKFAFEISLPLTEGYITKRNVKDGYEIQYPRDFTVNYKEKEGEIDREKEKDYYQTFESQDGKICIVVDYFKNLEGNSLDEYIKKSDLESEYEYGTKFEKMQINGIPILQIVTNHEDYKNIATLYFYKDKIYKVKLVESDKDGKSIITDQGREIYNIVINNFRPLQKSYLVKHGLKYLVGIHHR